MVINALNSGARTFMADFEDSHAPTWSGTMDGQVNLRDALLRTISYTAPNGKTYHLKGNTPSPPSPPALASKDGASPSQSSSSLATLIVRPRGWHMDEHHVEVDGEAMSASLFDFALYFYHNAHSSLAAGQGPYFYLPKMESHLEARLWNDVFNAAQDLLALPRSTIRATALIETLPAAFEMEEILFELRHHSAGLNCGRWDYIFSFIKKLRNHPEFVLPERAAVSMTSPFMDAYVRLLIQTCHKRGAHAMGGMSAHIPIRNNETANAAAMDKVRSDKLREVTAGHDGTWVAHPGLVPIATKVFDEHMPAANQLYNRRDDVVVTKDDLMDVKGLGLAAGGAPPSEEALRNNLNVALVYMESWLRGVGCVPIHNLMEDAATAEISRSQLWQWVRHGSKTADGQAITAARVEKLMAEEVAALATAVGPEKFKKSKFDLAAKLLLGTAQGGSYEDFLTLLCYDHLVVKK